MKKDFDIIDLDQTDTIPVVRDDYTEEEILQEEYIYTEESYIEEDPKSEYAQAEEIPDEDYEAEEMDASMAAAGEYAEIDESYPEEYMESVQDGFAESVQEGFGEETYSEEEYAGEYTDEYIEENADEYTEEYIAAEESGEEYFGIDEENAGSEVFQGEVSVDTILMSELSEEINEQAGEYTEPLDFVDINEISEEPYDDSEEYEDEEEDQSVAPVGKFAFFKDKIASFFSNFTTGDWVTAGMGVLILCVAIVTLAMWGRGGKAVEAVNMYDVGEGFSSIGIAGESGLLAMADAQMTVPMEEEPEEDAEVISVEVTFTSVDRDLKIKFINTESDRLITDVIFEVVLTDNSGKEYTFKDEDLDGIIYDKTIAPGEYQISITPMEGYEFVEFPETVTVKDHIVYEQIDVTQEIKNESEINAAVEDTAGNNAAAEAEAEVAPTVTDTVEWVESTRTPVDGSDGYRQINKDTIVEPSYSARNTISVASEQLAAGVPMQRYFIMDELFRTDISPYTVSGDNVSGNTPGEGDTGNSGQNQGEGGGETENPTPEHKDITANITISGAKDMTVGGDTITLTAAASADGSTVNGGTYTWSSTGGVSISSSGSSCVITAKQAGDATITVEFKKEDGNTTYTGHAEVKIHVSEKEEEKVTVTSVTVTPATLELAVSANRVISANAVMSDNSKVTAASSFTFVSDTPTVATVDATGKVVGVSAGTAKITVTYKDSYGNVKSAVCTVTVKLQTIQSIALDKTTLSIARGNTETLTATVTLSDGTKITDAGKMTWKSSNTGVVTVDAAGKITAVATGTAKITVTYKDSSGNTKSVECTVTVVANPADDTTSRLVDKNGNQVYVKDSSGNYVPATFADYYKASAFYIQSDVEYIYTGWQTINGNVYYYDKNHNKVTGDQIIQGIKYHFTDEGILAMNNNGVMGIDVSKYNGNIDWNAVKNSGVSFVIIRCGYRGSATGVLVEDPKFRSNIQGATAAGLKVGVYFFTQAVNEVEAVEEASMVLSLVKGYGLSYPIFIDTERTSSGNGRADRLDRATRTAVCKAFCETIRNAGYSAGVYASKSWFNDNLNYGSLSGYRIWLAQYASEPTFGNRYDMWQYSSTGTVSGISGKVDMNISYLGY